MVVADGDIQSIVFDCVVADGENVTTKLSLGDAYGLGAVSELELNWYEQAANFAVSVITNQSDIVDSMEVGFAYDLGTEFGAASWTNVDGAAGVSIDTDAFKVLTEKLVEQALVAKIEMEADRKSVV